MSVALSWSEITAELREAGLHFVPGLWPEPERPICNSLCEDYGIDLQDRVQLNYFLRILWISATTASHHLCSDTAMRAFHMNEAQAQLLATWIQQATYFVLMQIQEEPNLLPDGVVGGTLTLEQTDAEMPGPEAFKWSAIRPSPDQSARMQERDRKGAAASTPAQTAQLDQSMAGWQHALQEATMAFMSAATSQLLVRLATSQLQGSIRDASLEEIVDFVTVAEYEAIPARFRNLGRLQAGTALNIHSLIGRQTVSSPRLMRLFAVRGTSWSALYEKFIPYQNSVRWMGRRAQ